MLEIIQDPIFLKSANLILLIGLIGGGLFREMRAVSVTPKGMKACVSDFSAARMILGG